MESFKTPQSMAERDRYDDKYNLFLATVVRVDYERMVLTIKDSRSGDTFDGVSIIPSQASSSETKDVTIPEIGTRCLACRLLEYKGYAIIGIVSWITSGVTSAIDAVAHRPLPDTPGWSDRKRGVWRKSYPGQKTVNLMSGYTSKFDEGTDVASSDFSRTTQNTFRRTKIETNGGELVFNDSGVSMSGAVSRPGASSSDITPRTLPDGSQEWLLYLSGLSTDMTSRYTQGAPDMTPLVERTQKVPEFSLDYTLPQEVLGTDLVDLVLGVTDDLWLRTTIKNDQGEVAYDSNSFSINQTSDHPTSGGLLTKGIVGPTTKEGPTPQRKGWIIEKSEGTLVGSNLFDLSTYGKVLKPVIFSGKFNNDVTSFYEPVKKSQDQVETRLAASVKSLRFPSEVNTTRFDVTKEGMLAFEIGATLPKENIKWDGGTYEHPYGAGRSVEGNILGSVRLVVGKNRDEEESLDITTLGGTVLRMGADDTSLPTTRRNLQTQIRGNKDTLGARALQVWNSPKASLGDAGDLTNKSGMENVSLRAAMDGGMFLRLGARNSASRRRHLANGYTDGQGRQGQSPLSNRLDSKSPNRPVYGAGDAPYMFHDLTKTGSPQANLKGPYAWSGDSVGNMDTTGLSADIHAVRDILLRVGKNTQNNQSVLLDLDGGIVAAVGKDLLGHSLTAALDGGVQATIGHNNDGRSVGAKLEINGDVDISIKGNLHLSVTGDIYVDGVRITSIAKLSHVTKALVIDSTASVTHITESAKITHNEGGYDSEPVGS